MINYVDLFREHYREYLVSHPNRYTLSFKGRLSLLLATHEEFLRFAHSCLL